jgi:hypothetical protein
LKVGAAEAREESRVEKGMKVLLSVCDYIQEFAPTAQYLEDGTFVEVSEPRFYNSSKSFDP